MLDMFDKWKFDNPDGGAWKQGWDVRYKADAFDKEELLVIVMPHSHNDPGMEFQIYRESNQKIGNTRRVGGCKLSSLHSIMIKEGGMVGLKNDVLRKAH